MKQGWWWTCVWVVVLMCPAGVQAAEGPVAPAPAQNWVKPPIEPGQTQGAPTDPAAVFLPAMPPIVPTAPNVVPGAGYPAATPQMPTPPLLSAGGDGSGQAELVPGPATVPPSTMMVAPDLPQMVPPHTPQGLPIRPAPVFPAPKLLAPADANVIRELFRGVDAVRGLFNKPQSDVLIRKVLGMGDAGTKLLRLQKFMTMPRFEARYDETVLRDRSYDSWEYRKFGSFQTTLDGWIRTESLARFVDWKFCSRRGAYVFVRGSLTKSGPLSGSFELDGSDTRRQKWNLNVEFRNVLLHDDGLPCTGSIKISGWDPTGRSMVFTLDFPCPVGVPVPFPKAPIHMNPSPNDGRR